MKEKKHYISLSFKGGNCYYQNGQRLKLSERIVNIGETPDCDVRYESDGLQPEYYASIIQNEDGQGWRIVKRSQYVEISIVGKGIIGYVHQLEDGDHIRFGSQQMGLCFHTHYDNHYDEEGQNRFWIWIVAGMICLVTLIAVVFGFINKPKGISTEDVEPLEESVYLLKVDSVSRILVANGEEVCMPPTNVFDEAPTGTAFMTTDGTLITARHCVEYWIGKNIDLTTKFDELDKNDIIRWAIEAETFNQMHDADSCMLVRVFFSIFDFMGNKKYSFASTDKNVHINKENDGLFMLTDFSQNYYWRSIRPQFTDRQMELGDILWIDGFKEQGKVKMVSENQMRNVKNGTKLVICGYPITGIGDKRMMCTEGTIRRNPQADSENLFFESNINHGFSGGPVLMKIDADIVAIGVVSRVDSISSGLYKWAVPVTEVNRKSNE